MNAKKILEAGCNIGNNLGGFPANFDVSGLDLNEKAIKKASSNYPNFKFKTGSLLEIPFPDECFDLVFTRGVLIHIPQEEMNQVLNELLRVSNKWILNLEYYGEDGKMIKWKRGNDLLWYRDMKKRWSTKNVEIISDVEIPEEIDVGKTRLTLIRKNKF